MRKVLTVMLLLLSVLGGVAHDEQLVSPNRDIRLAVDMSDTLRLSVYRGAEQLLAASPVFMQTDRATLGVNPRKQRVCRTVIHEQKKNIVPIKNAVTTNHANQLLIAFKGGYSIELRAYDNGVAYRFILDRKGDVDVVNEGMCLHFPQSFGLHLSKTKGFWTSYENAYTHTTTADYAGEAEMSYLPVLLESPLGTKMLLSESDVRDYPHMFVRSEGPNTLSAVFPFSPEQWEPAGDRGFLITKEWPFIARTHGQRSFPWRFMVIGDDATIAANELANVLGGLCELDDTSWIKPGKVSWDWWNHWTVWGVDFEVGINNDTYKYFIDFAARYGIEYILLDEGWCKDVRDPFTPRDQIDIRQLVEYGRERGVGVFLWFTWLAVEQHPELIDHYAGMGVRGLKIDFMDHSDQWMVNFYERVARACARQHLLVDFHGSFKPAGLEIRYPNVISYEGVRGMEQGGGCHPDNTIWLPYIRNAVGAMDFTPGAMQSTQPEDFCGTGSLPMASGTRAYQMALYVLFESALQMLADSPTRYMQADECTRFIAAVPTTWDESRVLAAKAGSYYVVARRKGQRWFLGAMTGSQPRHLSIDLSFLSSPGVLTAFQDGTNAHRIAVDYKQVQLPVQPADTLSIQLARNGGWCAVVDCDDHDDANR